MEGYIVALIVIYVHWVLIELMLFIMRRSHGEFINRLGTINALGIRPAMIMISVILYFVFIVALVAKYI